MTRRVDGFAHVLPESTYESLLDACPGGALSRVGEPEKFWDVETRLTDMDDFDVDAQVLTFTQHDWARPGYDEALRILEAAHDELRGIVDDHPDRFVPVGTLPRLGSAYIDEFERTITDLDFAGVQIFSNYDGRPLDAEEFAPFFEGAASHDVPVWIHPRTHDWYDWTRQYSIHKMLGWPFETGLAIARLVFGGVFDRHPGLDVVTHHTGGIVPFLGERIRGYYEKEDRTDWVDLARPVGSYFERIYADTMIHGNVPALELGHDFFGPGRLIFGTDYPFGPGNGREYMDVTTAAVEAMDCSPEERAAVFGGNVESLVG